MARASARCLSVTGIASCLLLVLSLDAVFSQPLYAAVTTSSGVVTDPLNLTPAVKHAYALFYIQDYPGAISEFKKILAEHPQDPIAVDYLLDATLFQALYRLDLLDTTFYAHDGFLKGKQGSVKVDPKVAQRIQSLVDEAENLADQRLKKDPKDVDALYARGWARGLDAVYTGLVERSFISSLRQALGASSDDREVLDLSPHYVDARMVVGIHQYVVGSLPLTFKILAGLVGIHGSKEKGIADLREAGARGIITSVEARVALSLFLRRDAQYQAAIEVMQSLRAEYPRDFLFCLEVANLTKDIGHGQAAIADYRKIIEMAKKPGYFPAPQSELAWFGLGDALRGQNQLADAAHAYEEAASTPGVSAGLKGRSLLNAGEVYDLMNQRAKAKAAYQQAQRADPGSPRADAARKYLRSPYTRRDSD